MKIEENSMNEGQRAVLRAKCHAAINTCESDSECREYLTYFAGEAVPALLNAQNEEIRRADLLQSTILVKNAEIDKLWAERDRWKARAEALERFKAYWYELYGANLEVKNWHENGEAEPFDNFYDSAEAEEARV